MRFAVRKGDGKAAGYPPASPLRDIDTLHYVLREFNLNDLFSQDLVLCLQYSRHELKPAVKTLSMFTCDSAQNILLLKRILCLLGIPPRFADANLQLAFMISISRFF